MKLEQCSTCAGIRINVKYFALIPSYRRRKRLDETCKAYQLVREAQELSNWIKTKEQHATIQVEILFINILLNVLFE